MSYMHNKIRIYNADAADQIAFYIRDFSVCTNSTYSEKDLLWFAVWVWAPPRSPSS